MKKLCLLLILSAFFFSCGVNDKGRYVPMDYGVLDTRTGDLYKIKWSTNIPSLQNEAYSKIEKIEVTNFIKGTRREFDFKDETRKNE